jgi:hypothetical protein
MSIEASYRLLLKICHKGLDHAFGRAVNSMTTAIQEMRVSSVVQSARTFRLMLILPFAGRCVNYPLSASATIFL